MKEEHVIIPHFKTQSPFIKNLLILFMVLLVIFLTTVISFVQFRTPEVISADEKIDQFSAKRAMNYLKEFAVIPHPSGSEEHDRVRDYLVKTLTDFGVSPEIQSLEGVVPAWGAPFDGKIENIVTRIPGEDPFMTIMITAHYDSVPDSPGAADDGAGVAAILETTRILSQFKTLKNDVIILITDGEEIGLSGAKGFVEQHPWADDVDLVLNFEARGSAGPALMFETNEENGTLISEFVKGSPNPVAHSFTYDLYKKLHHDTDLTVFKNAGMYGLNFGFFANSHSYHLPADKIENLSLDSLQHQGDYMVHLVEHFGNIDFVNKEEGNKLFFNVLGKNVITYSKKLVTPIMITSIILFVLSFIHGYMRKKLTLTGASVGFFLFILTIMFVFFVGENVWNLISAIFRERILMIERDLTISNAVFVGFIFILYAVVALIYQFISKKVNIYNLTMGAYFVWLLLVVFSSISFKASSYIFAWPLIFGLIGMNMLMRLKNDMSLNGYAITTGFAIPAIIIAVPALYLIYVLFTLQAMGTLLALTTLLGVFILPVLSGLRLRKTIGLPVALLSIGLFIFLGTIVLF